MLSIVCRRGEKLTELVDNVVGWVEESAEQRETVRGKLTEPSDEQNEQLLSGHELTQNECM